MPRLAMPRLIFFIVLTYAGLSLIRDKISRQRDFCHAQAASMPLHRDARAENYTSLAMMAATQLPLRFSIMITSRATSGHGLFIYFL